MKDISGKTAIVTGAASGIGLGIATALAAERTVPMIAEHGRGVHGWGSEIVFTPLSSDPEPLFSCSSLPHGLVGCYRRICLSG